jgi:hypothetical protein
MEGSGAGKGEEVVVLTVDDSGCGMSEAQVRRIFGHEVGHDVGYEVRRDACGDVGLGGGTEIDPDPAGSRTDAAENGLQTHPPRRRHGLGLQIVRELVAASGGDLLLQSKLGVGTRIEIHWPATGVAVAAASHADLVTLTAGAATGSGHRPAANAHDDASTEQRPAVGPVGIDDEQLRAMMLRLHRSAPGERIRAGIPTGFGPRDGTLDEARTGARTGTGSHESAHARPASERLGVDTLGTQPGEAAARRWFRSGSVPHSSERLYGGTTTSGPNAGDPAPAGGGPETQGMNRNGTDNSALKGAIAC